MNEAIYVAQSKGDTLGGVVSCICKNVPAGIGEPVFNKLHDNNTVSTKTNHSGGVQGGISNGQNINFRVAMMFVLFLELYL